MWVDSYNLFYLQLGCWSLEAAIRCQLDKMESREKFHQDRWIKRNKKNGKKNGFEDGEISPSQSLASKA